MHSLPTGRESRCVGFTQLAGKQAVSLMHDIYSIQECKCFLPDWSKSVSNRVGSTVAALSPVGVVLFGPGAGTTISEGSL